MKAHFRKLHGEISISAMDAIIYEQCLPFAGPQERALLLKMLQTKNIQERYSICEEYLNGKGYPVKGNL